MDSTAEIPECPVCGFSSIYTNGFSPCSVRCAIVRTENTSLPEFLTLKEALALVREEAKERGLPSDPDIRDMVSSKYYYIRVVDKASTLWKLDRCLLSSGLNVEYMIVSSSAFSGHTRIYRIASQLIKFLPEEMLDYPQCVLSSAALYKLFGGSPYWNFLPCR